MKFFCTLEPGEFDNRPGSNESYQNYRFGFKKNSPKFEKCPILDFHKNKSYIKMIEVLDRAVEKNPKKTLKNLKSV